MIVAVLPCLIRQILKRHEPRPAAPAEPKKVKISEAQRRRVVLQALREGSMTVADAALECDTSYDVTYSAVRDLYRGGYVERISKTRPIAYGLTEKGLALLASEEAGIAKCKQSARRIVRQS